MPKPKPWIWSESWTTRRRHGAVEGWEGGGVKGSGGTEDWMA
jgi:hypothetical protein